MKIIISSEVVRSYLRGIYLDEFPPEADVVVKDNEFHIQHKFSDGPIKKLDEFYEGDGIINTSCETKSGDFVVSVQTKSLKKLRKVAKITSDQPLVLTFDGSGFIGILAQL